MGSDTTQARESLTDLALRYAILRYRAERALEQRTRENKRVWTKRYRDPCFAKDPEADRWHRIYRLRVRRAAAVKRKLNRRLREAMGTNPELPENVADILAAAEKRGGEGAEIVETVLVICEGHDACEADECPCYVEHAIQPWCASGFCSYAGRHVECKPTMRQKARVESDESNARRDEGAESSIDTSDT